MTDVSGPKLTVGFLCHPYHRGGVTRWMVDAAAEWTRQGQTCWFVVPTPRIPFLNGAGRPALVELIEALPLAQRPSVATAWVGAGFEYGTVAHRARTYARIVQDKIPPGVPILVSDDPSTWRAIEMLGGRNPLIGVLHADEEPYYELAARYRRTAAALVAVSERIRIRSLNSLEGSGAALAVIPCGIPLPAFGEHAAAQTSLLRLVWVGRITERQKRVSDLAKVASHLRDVGTRFHLDILGDGESRTELRVAMQEAGILQHVRFHGWLTSVDVLAVLRRSDVMLLPSNFEGMPVAAMEALASGCAVVASDSSGLEEYARSALARDTLWIHTRGDVEGAVRMIRAAHATPRGVRRSAARQLAQEEFSIQRCVARYDELLKHLPQRPCVDSSIAKWHPADVVSRGVAFTRRLRSAVSRRLLRDAQSRDSILSASAFSSA